MSDTLDKFLEREQMLVVAGERLDEASRLAREAGELLQDEQLGFAGITALQARDAANTAELLIFRVLGREVVETTPELTEEEEAEIDREIARCTAAEDLEEACEAALEYLADYAPRTYNDARIEVYGKLRNALEKARPSS